MNFDPDTTKMEFDAGFDHEYQSPSVSDCESGTSGSNYDEIRPSLGGNGLMMVNEDNIAHRVISHKFISGLGLIGGQAKVETIHRNAYLGYTGKARLHSFQLFSKAVEKKNGGNPNVKYAWYGASKDEIQKIISLGFGKSENNGLYGCGVYLSADTNSIESVQSSVIDEHGLRHVLLCRVILGKMESIPPGSRQCCPSSEEFDSGVDNLIFPKKYIVWNTHMNTYILPEYVISFRAPFNLEGHQIRSPLRIPSSPWMPFPTLVSALSKLLPGYTMEIVTKHHNDHREKKISRHEFITKIRQVAGDELLMMVIKSYRNKQLEASARISPINGSIRRKRSGATSAAC